MDERTRKGRSYGESKERPGIKNVRLTAATKCEKGQRGLRHHGPFSLGSFPASQEGSEKITTVPSEKVPKNDVNRPLRTEVCQARESIKLHLPWNGKTDVPAPASYRAGKTKPIDAGLSQGPMGSFQFMVSRTSPHEKSRTKK